MIAQTLVSAIAALGAWSEAPSCPRDTISRRALGEAMREARLAPGGDYALLATMNSVRFQSAVFKSLLESALRQRPGGGTLFIPYDALWWEYLKVAGLDAKDTAKAPIGRRLAFEYHQSIELTYGPPGVVIKSIRKGQPPLLAANVRLDWPDRPDGLRKFSFDDTLSVPKLRSTNHQVMTFRFLVFRDMMVFDEIEGISGRPLSGFLGTLFKLMGEGQSKYARFSVSADGRQILRAKATKVVSKTVTATINADGSAQNGVPDDRPDLLEIEARLKQPLEFEYHPYRCPGTAGLAPPG